MKEREILRLVIVVFVIKPKNDVIVTSFVEKNRVFDFPLLPGYRLPRFVIYGPIWMKLTANERGGNFTPRFCDKTRNNVTMTSFVKIMRGKLSVSDCTYHL